MTPPHARPRGTGRRTSPRLATAVLCVGLFILGMDLTILNVAVPALRSDLHATLAEVQWIVDGYALALGATVLAAGNVTDRVGRRRFFLAGLLLCGAVSALGALSRTPAQLVAARCGMGLGAALLMPATLALISTLHHEAASRRRAIAAWTATGAVGGLTGPLVGGHLVEAFSWRAAFWINVPLTALTAALALVLVPRTEQHTPEAGHRSMDTGGLALSAGGFLALIWAVIESPSLGWTHPAVLTAYGLAAALLSAFVRWERRSPHPMLPLPLLRDARIGAGAACLALMSLTLFGALFILTLYLQGVLGCTPSEAGARILPLPGGLAAGALAAPALMSRLGRRPPVVLGLVLVAAAFAVQAGTTPESGYGRVVVFTGVAGIGAGMVACAATESVMGAVPPRRAALGSAINDATRQVGAALGVAVQGSVLTSTYTHDLRTRLGGRLPPGPLPLPGATAPHTAPGPLVATAREAFVSAVTTTAFTALAITLVTTLAAWFWLPSEAPDRLPETTGAPAP
ncbi:MFS transporter [Streptomyces roseifaciens]